ncbi:hypothetical protein FJU30_18220 [Affinibrenneria salicis]|uniref:RHS protein conserved region domain-containing protein n=1 Tax=Affinibrenneria salicis TaxID=2590031 RepID=A0A5J5FWA6_9GAMM|nr:hypothetical protein FJU30_18220 [Affinibrenneria salicis]
MDPQPPVKCRIYLYHCDHLGTPQALIDDAGHTAWRIQLEPRGNTLDGDNPLDVDQPIRMQGQHYDEESGLFYNRYRYYDPGTGRYVTQDPIGLAGGWNFYAYPLNPVSNIDPLGLDACKVLYPDYPIEYMAGLTSIWLGGHGGIIGYDKHGSTKYYEYGRYEPDLKGIVGIKLPAADGNIRSISMPGLVLDKNGNPDNESHESLKMALSKRSGKNTRVELT